jgi:hypothetical protein
VGIEEGADVGIEEVRDVALERRAGLIALIQPKKSAVLLLASDTCPSAHQVRDAERDDDTDHDERLRAHISLLK